MSDWYKPADERIGEYKAIKNRVTKELALVGKYGQIWLYSDTHCAAVILSARIAKKYLPKDQHPVLPTDETQIRFPLSELKTWARILKVPRKRELMLGYLEGQS